MKTHLQGKYEIDDDVDRLDFKTLERWLSQTYWSPGIAIEEIRKGALNSTLAVGCYHGQEQVGYMRLVSDKTRFAYIMDVYVAPGHRHKGIARHMVRFSLDHPELKDVYQWLLATRDAHAVYSAVGFNLLTHPERWMMLVKQKNTA